MDLDDREIAVAGTLALFPSSQAFLARRSLPTPRVSGVTLSMEEPLRVAVSDPEAVFATGVTGEGGTFQVPGVHVLQINTTLAAGLSGEAGFARTSSVLFDTALSGGRPHLDLVDTRAYALPQAFEAQLETALGEFRIMELTGDFTTQLTQAGYILGRVVDAAGQPVASVTVVPDREGLADRMHYPSADLTSMGRTATDANGLFLYVHSGDARVQAFRLTVAGRELAAPPHAGAVTGRGMLVELALP